MHILVVDDSKTMRHIAKVALGKMGFHDVLLCESGEQALQILEKESVDLVLLDWHMPKMDGIECLKNIRSNPITKNTPVFMLTVEQGKDSVSQAVQSGATDYILKPLHPIVLMQKLGKLSKKTGNRVFEQVLALGTGQSAKEKQASAKRSIQVRTKGKWRVFELPQVAWTSSVQITPVVERVLGSGAKHLLFDLAHIHTFTTASFGVIMKCLKLCKENQAEFFVSNASKDVQDLFQASSLGFLLDAIQL